MIVENSGMPREKPIVPSIGSITHAAPRFHSPSAPNSSPRIAASGSPSLQHAPDRLLGGAIRLGDGRAVLLDLDRHLSEARQDLGARGVGRAFGESGERGEVGRHRRAGYRRARAAATATRPAIAVCASSGSAVETTRPTLGTTRRTGDRMAPTLAERLGFAATERIAIVHADDIGMCHAANLGAFDALENGVVSCGSIMVPCPWFREAADLAAANPAFDLGVHLTLNSEWPGYRWGPVAGRDRVPSLLDAQGYLPRTTVEVVRSARPDEVEIELRAQIEAALAAGIDVTHLDSHMGTVFFPPFVPIYAKLASEYRLPAMAVRPDPETLARRRPRGSGCDPAEGLRRARSVGTSDPRRSRRQLARLRRRRGRRAHQRPTRAASGRASRT